MQALNLSIATKPLGWILRENGFLVPFGVMPILSETGSLGDANEWKEVKVIPAISILTSCDSEIVCPSVYCRKKLTKNHSFDAHIREHLGYKATKSEALNTNRAKNKTVAINYYCNHKGCIYSINDGERFFTKLKYLKQHYLKVHAPKTFICNQCQKSFGTAVFLEIHSRMCGHVFICSCKATYGTLEALQTHARRKNHDYDHAGYRNILKSFKHSNTIGKLEDELVKDKVKDNGKITPPKNKKTQPVLLPKPQPVLGNLVAAPWVYDDFSCATLKVDFGTQTVPMLSFHQSGQPSTSQKEILKLAKRKKSAETQTSQVRVRISTETQTANVVKRRRSNRKKQLAEAETQCHTDDAELPVVASAPNAKSEKCEEEQSKPKLEPLLDVIFFPTKEATTNNGTNTTDSIFDGLNTFSCSTEYSESAPEPPMSENVLHDLEEVHSQTQTDPYLFSGTDNSSMFDDFDASLNSGVNDVSELLNFVTTETQTLPGIVISPSIMNISTNSSPTDTANTQTIDNINFLIDSSGSDTPDMASVFDDYIQCPKFSDGLSSGSGYLETMDNETQTQCYDFSIMISNMFGTE